MELICCEPQELKNTNNQINTWANILSRYLLNDIKNEQINNFNMMSQQGNANQNYIAFLFPLSHNVCTPDGIINYCLHCGHIMKACLRKIKNSWSSCITSGQIPKDINVVYDSDASTPMFLVTLFTIFSTGNHFVK